MFKTCIVFSQNVKLESLTIIKEKISDCETIVLITTHHLFDYELEYINKLLQKNIEAYTFADYISKDEMIQCDMNAYEFERLDILKYYEEIKRIKNEMIADNFLGVHSFDYKFILSDDLGIDKKVWISRGFQYINVQYYYCHSLQKYSIVSSIKATIKKNPLMYRVINNHKRKEPLQNVYVGYWGNQKYVFIGKMNRVTHHLQISFEKSDEETERLNSRHFETKDKCVYLTSIHESAQVNIPDAPRFEVYQIQDGYIPPVYSYAYKFIPGNHGYYAWDTMGERVFKAQKIPVKLMPFRKKLYMPYPVIPTSVKKVVIVASGAGDWTAMKNRSDEDLMVEAFVKLAEEYKDITFVYRCHPTWVHPRHQGVNSINRIAEYFDRAGYKNIVLSSNIPQNTLENFSLTYSRSSLEEDLKNADIVFGDHSVSMIDAAMEKTVFASVNVMKRQNLFSSMTELGFPHCESIKEISDFIESIQTDDFERKYKLAVDRYNAMIDEENNEQT